MCWFYHIIWPLTFDLLSAFNALDDPGHDLLLLLLTEHGLGLSFSFGLGSRSRRGQGHDRVKVTSLTFDLLSAFNALDDPESWPVVVVDWVRVITRFRFRVKVTSGSRSRVIITMTSIVLRYILTLNRNWMITLTHAQSTTTTTGHDPGSSNTKVKGQRSKVK